MGTLLLRTPRKLARPPKEEAGPAADVQGAKSWLVFQYAPVALFSLKPARATSTAGKTLLAPTPYAVKMAFLDSALRNGLVSDAETLVRSLAGVSLRIGLPEQVCVTGTIQSIRLETRAAERKLKPELAPYRSSIALREFVHYEGTLRLAFHLASSQSELTSLLLQAGAAINYLGKRGSFIQYLGVVRQPELDETYTMPLDNAAVAVRGSQIATLDDFGPGACFAAMNSYSPAPIKVGVHRAFVETIVPLEMYNSGAGFLHFRNPRAMLNEFEPRREGD